MGLDATVYCDCFESGRLMVLPLSTWNVIVDGDGERLNDSDDPDVEAFDDWNLIACPHANGVFLSNYLGNTASVSLVHKALARTPDRFPLMPANVVYSGSHCGDHIPADEVSAYRAELIAMADVHDSDEVAEECLPEFEDAFAELVDIALRLGKPIAF